jgi:hypothetical protein
LLSWIPHFSQTAWYALRHQHSGLSAPPPAVLASKKWNECEINPKKLTLGCGVSSDTLTTFLNCSDCGGFSSALRLVACGFLSGCSFFSNFLSGHSFLSCRSFFSNFLSDRSFLSNFFRGCCCGLLWRARVAALISCRAASTCSRVPSSRSNC